MKRPVPPLSTGVGGLCPQGKYCPEGTDVPINCPRGRYNNRLQLKNWTDCELCDYGRYCGTEGLNSTSGGYFIIDRCERFLFGGSEFQSKLETPSKSFVFKSITFAIILSFAFKPQYNSKDSRIQIVV